MFNPTPAIRRIFSSLFLVVAFVLQVNGQDSIKIITPRGWLDTVVDGYGNRYNIGEISLQDTIRAQFSGGVVQPLIMYSCTSGYFQLWLEQGSGVENYGSDPNHQARLNVICQVLHDISSLINSPLTSSGQKVNIWVRDINNITTGGTPLGLATSFYNAPSASTLGGIIDNASWITILSGTDAYTNVASPIVTLGGQYSNFGTFFHGMMAFDFSTSVNWHTNLSTSTASGTYDLYTITLHEMLHALGFASLIDESGLSKLGPTFNYYTRYDQFLYSDVTSPIPLITNSGSCSMYQYTWNNALPLSVLTPDLSSCNTDYTECSTAIKYYGGLTSPQPVYTPNCWEGPSSLHHFEDECLVPLTFTPQPPLSDNLYFVMSNANGMGSSYMKRYPKPEERQVLCDIGYNVNTTYGNNTTASGSYYSYGGSPCPGSQVAGINDGINNGMFVFNYNGTPVTINNGTMTFGFMTNDVNADGFECLEDITDMTPGTFNVTAGANTDFVSYDAPPGVFGIRLLRYTPVRNTGERGNITYIYVYVTDPNCPAGCVSEMVLNGGFENSQNCGEFWIFGNGPVSISCWENLFNTPGLHKRFCADMPIPTNLSYLPSDVHTMSTLPNDNFIHIQAGHTNNMFGSEAVQTMLSTPMTQGNTYRLRFWAKIANSYFYNGYQPYLRIGGSPSTLAGGFGGMTSLPVNISDLGLTPMVPADNDWHLIEHVFTYSDPTPLQNLIIINAGWEMPYPQPATALVYIDDVSLQLDNNLAQFTPPTPVSSCATPVDLSTYVTVPGGTFTGFGVSGVMFDPATALAQSLANQETNFVTVQYDYTDGAGCPQILQAQIEIQNANPNLAIFAPSNVCHGENFSMYVTGGAPGTNYVWTPSVPCTLPCDNTTTSITTPTFFTVSNTDNTGCTSIISQFINIWPDVSSATASPSVGCLGEPVTLCAWNMTTFNWSPPGGLSSTTVQCPTTLPIPGIVTYTVTGTDNFGCQVEEQVAVVTPYEQGCDPCSMYGNVGDFNVIGDVNGIVTLNSVNGNWFVYQDIFITGDVTFQNAVILMAPGVQIQVMPGGRLTINHSHLYTNCGMWKGIKVEGSSTQSARLVVTNSSFIEDAEQAVYVPNGTYPPGSTDILLIENSIFNKNHHGIVITNNNTNAGGIYPYTIRGNVFTSRGFNLIYNFQNWPFTWPNIATGPDAPRVFWNNGQYLPPVNIDNPALFFTPVPCNDGNPAIDGVMVVNVGGNAQLNEVVIGEVPPVWQTELNNSTLNVFDQLKYGIYADRANFHSINNTFMNMQGQMMSYGPFQGTGIYARDILSGLHRARITQPPGNANCTNRFYECLVGVETNNYYSVSGTNAMMVSNHAINTVPYNGVFGYLCKSSKYKNYDLSRNTITNIETGIAFEATTYAISGGEGQIAGPVSISDNTIQAAYGPPTTQFLMNAIWLQNLVNCYPCVNNQYTAMSDIRVLNNTINNTRNGIFADNFWLQPVLSIGNDITMENYAPHPQHGIMYALNNHGRIQQNEIAGPGINYAIPWLSKGINVKSCNNTTVHCNYTFETSIGIQYDGWSQATSWRYNEMRNHSMGLLMNNNGIMDPQGTWNDAIHNLWTTAGSFNWTGANRHTHCEFSASVPSSMFVDISLPNEEPLNNTSQPPLNEFQLNVSYYNTSDNNPYPCQPFDYIVLQMIGGGDDEDPGGYYRAARDEMSYQSQEDRQKWNNQFQVWRSIQANNSLIDSSAVLQEFNTLASNTRYNHLTEIESAVAQGEFGMAGSLLADNTADDASGLVYGSDSVVITDDSVADNIVQNNKLFYEIYMRFMQDSLLSTDTADVLQLSLSCPLVEGNIVHNFRNLYNSITQKMIVFEDSCVLDSAGNFGNGARYAKPTPPDSRPKARALVKQTNEQEYKLSPNPYSSGPLVIRQKLSDQNMVNCGIFNSAGQSIYTGELHFRQNMTEIRLPSLRQGLYLVRLTDSEGREYILKLTVI